MYACDIILDKGTFVLEEHKTLADINTEDISSYLNLSLSLAEISLLKI